MGKNSDNPTCSRHVLQVSMRPLSLLRGEGLTCGVLDPDFTDPLDGKLTLERGFRHTLDLDCEDESLNFSRAVGSMRHEPRDGVGFGLAFLEADLSGGKGEEIRVLLFSEKERNTLIKLLDHLQTDHRSFRRRGASLLGWLPAGCGAGCLTGCIARKKPPGIPHDPSDLSPRHASQDQPFTRTRSEDAMSMLLADFKTFAKQMFDRQSSTGFRTLLAYGTLGNARMLWVVSARNCSN